MFRGEHINFLVRLTLGQPAVCPGVNRTLTRAKSLCLCAFFLPDFEFTRFWFLWFPLISPHTLPSASREIPSRSSQKTSKGSTAHTHPTGPLRGPAAILFISRDPCSDSIAKLFCACFYGVSHNYRAIRSTMGYRTDVSV